MIIFWSVKIYGKDLNFKFHKGLFHLKELHHRSLIPVCLQIDPESYEWG